MSQKKSITEIVLEEFNQYLNKCMLSEADNNKQDDTHMTSAQRQAKARIMKANARDGKKVGDNTSQEVRDFLNDPSVNVSDVMVQATGLAPTSASSLGAKIAKGERPVKAKLAQTVHKIQSQLK